MLGLAYILLEEERYFDEPEVDNGDLVLSFGTFKVTSDGVNATLRPPLERLSGHHPWDRVAMGLGLLKLFFVGVEGSSVDRFATMFLTDAQKDRLEELFIEHEEQWEIEANALMSWGANNLAFRCPYGSVSHDLVRLETLQNRALDDFVRSRFPL